MTRTTSRRSAAGGPAASDRADRRHLLALLERYLEHFPQDRPRVEAIRDFVAAHSDCFERSCRKGHVTGSAWVVSGGGAQALLVHHRKLDAWLQPGGHADGDPDVAAVALREAAEESGLSSLRLVDWSGAGATAVLPFDVDVHRIPARGEEAEHLHFDVRFLVEGDSAERPRASPESSAVRWVERSEIATLTTEPSLLRMATRAARLLPGR